MEVFGEAPLTQSANAAVPAVVLPELSAVATAIMGDMQGVVLSGSSGVPNDPRYGDLWGMQGGSAGSRANEAWAAGTTGKMNSVVGVIDSGIDYTHPDLYLNIWLNQREIPTTLRASLSDIDFDGLITFRDLNNAANASYVLDYNKNGRIDAGDLLNDVRWENGVDEDGNGRKDDLIGWDFVNNDNDPLGDNNHGTHVAGTIGARGGDGFGVAGVNWNVQMVALKFLNASNSGSMSKASAAINYFTDAAINAAIGENFVATNNSWGGVPDDPGLRTAISRAAEQDILFIASAGNKGTNNDTTPRFPTNFSISSSYGDVVVSVASITNTGARSSFSNFGASSVDIGAPGSSILSTVRNGVHEYFSGTSMAAPHVTGAMALYASLFPYATSAQIRDALLGSAEFTAGLNDLVATNGRLDIPDMLAIRPRATEFRDVLVGEASADVFDGRAGNDSLVGNAGSDSLLGGAGADTLDGGADADSLIGGSGADIASYADASAAVRVNLATGRATGAAGADTLAGVEGVLGGAGNDLILGDTLGNGLWGANGADTLDGGADADTLNGGLGNDLIIGGSGVDIASYADASAAVTVNLATRRATGAAGADTLAGVEGVLGGAGNDSILGNTLANALGGANGADTLDGGADADTLIGGLGNDSIIGGSGVDIASYADASAAVTVNLATGRATGAAGADTLAGVEGVLGGAANDSILGDGLANTLWGANGADTLDGGQGDDVLSGDAGDDLILGNVGSDTILGGAGNDVINGGTGSDNFIFSAAIGAPNVDTIQFYSVSDDTILLDDAVFSTIGAAGTTLAVGAFMTGAAATSISHRIIFDSATGALFYDADGSGAAAAVQFATLTGISGSISNAEFLII